MARPTASVRFRTPRRGVILSRRGRSGAPFVRRIPASPGPQGRGERSGDVVLVASALTILRKHLRTGCSGLSGLQSGGSLAARLRRSARDDNHCGCPFFRSSSLDDPSESGHPAPNRAFRPAFTRRPHARRAHHRRARDRRHRQHPGIHADVVIDGERIADISPAGAPSTATPRPPFIDAEGMICCPGFIDNPVHIRSSPS